MFGWGTNGNFIITRKVVKWWQILKTELDSYSFSTNSLNVRSLNARASQSVRLASSSEKWR